MSFKGSFLTTVGLGVIGGGVVVISYSYTGIPCSMSRGGIVEGGGIVTLEQTIRHRSGAPE